MDSPHRITHQQVLSSCSALLFHLPRGHGIQVPAVLLFFFSLFNSSVRSVVTHVLETPEKSPTKVAMVWSFLSTCVRVKRKTKVVFMNTECMKVIEATRAPEGTRGSTQKEKKGEKWMGPHGSNARAGSNSHPAPPMHATGDARELL